MKKIINKIAEEFSKIFAHCWSIVVKNIKFILYILIFVVLITLLYLYFRDTKFNFDTYEVLDNSTHNKNQLIREAIERSSVINSYFKNNETDKINAIRKNLKLSDLPCKNLLINPDSCNCSQKLVKEINIDVPDPKTFIKLKVSKGPFEAEVQDSISLLRKFLGKEAIDITVSMRLNEQKIYEISVLDSKETAENFDLAKEKVAILLLKYTSPISYVNLMNNTLDFDAEESIKYGIEHDLYSDLSTIHSLLGELQIDKSFLLQDKAILDKAFESFTKANSYGGTEISTIGIIKIKRFKGSTTLDNEDYEKLNRIIANGNYSAQAYIEKFQNMYIQGILNKHDIFSAINKNPNLAELKLYYVSYLAEEKDLIELRKFVNKIKGENFENSKLNSLNIQSKLPEIFLYLAEYEQSRTHENLSKIEELFVDLNFCEKNLWIRYLLNFLDFRLDDTKIRNILRKQLAIVDHQFKGDFSFYYTYADVLNKLGKKTDSIEKYNEALTHIGPHHLVYTNISSIMLDIADSSKNIIPSSEVRKIYFNAEIYALKSLNLKPSFDSALNYINALFSQQKYKQYVIEFEKWGPLIKNKLDQEGNLFAYILLDYGLSNCLVNENDVAKEALIKAKSYQMINSIKLYRLNSCLGISQ